MITEETLSRLLTVAISLPDTPVQHDGNVTGNHGEDDYWVVKLAFQAPVADFSAIPTSGSAPLNVSFTDNSQITLLPGYGTSVMELIQ